MGKCYYCQEQERTTYFSYYCEDCAMLRRLLLVYDAKECIAILKRTCLRNDKQIDFKIGQEIKKITKLPEDVKEELLSKSTDLYEHKVATRSKKKEHN